jgi:ACS family glucarate transporter-like MFS transporter
MSSEGSATRVRYALLAVATANAFLLYLDRICMSTIVLSPIFLRELKLGQDQVGRVLMAFFLTYALGQPAAGWLADRFGPRRMLVTYILLWSASTLLTGFAWGLASLLLTRLACGLSESGAYPASARVVARWFPYHQRGKASSVVAFGGRVGSAVAPWLTVSAIILFGAWRPVLWIYGSIGFGLAALTHFVFRDDPALHPGVNEAEREYIQSGGPAPAPPDHRFPWRAIISHSGLWMLSLGAIGLNFGWGFLITWLPKYLQTVRGMSERDASFYNTVILACGIAGILFGGWWCDALTRWFGQRWGRRLPILCGGVAGALAYLACPLLHGPYGVVLACCLVAFATDSANASVWTFSQDIGGGYVAATLAWSNMWGNLGAAAVAGVIPSILGEHPQSADWNHVFWTLAGAFVLFAAVSVFIDATKSLRSQQQAADNC